MDPIKIEKLQAMRKYRKNQFLSNLILYSLIALTCSLCFSSPFWFPSLCSSMKFFFFVSLPNIWSFIFNPKCLFIVGNIIVVFLVRDSKLADSNSSPKTDVYDDYVKEIRSLRRFSSPEEKKEERKLEIPLIEESVKKVHEDGEEAKGEKGEKEEVKKGSEEDLDDEEEPAELLNKRVEEFIARINKQRRLEASTTNLKERKKEN